MFDFGDLEVEVEVAIRGPFRTHDALRREMWESPWKKPMSILLRATERVWSWPVAGEPNLTSNSNSNSNSDTDTDNDTGHRTAQDDGGVSRLMTQNWRAGDLEGYG